MVELTCHNCELKWDYAGDPANYYATCPRCRYKVNIKRQLRPDKMSKGGAPQGRRKGGAF